MKIMSCIWIGVGLRSVKIRVKLWRSHRRWMRIWIMIIEWYVLLRIRRIMLVFIWLYLLICFILRILSLFWLSNLVGCRRRVDGVSSDVCLWIWQIMLMCSLLPLSSRGNKSGLRFGFVYLWRYLRLRALSLFVWLICCLLGIILLMLRKLIECLLQR